MLGATILQSQVGLVSRASRGISTRSRRNFLFARRNSTPTPWFVDEDTERSSISVEGDQSDNVNLKNEGQMIVQRSPPPPINAPNHLRVLHAHLITLPLLDSVSVVRAKSSGDGDLLSVEEDSLPTRRPRGRRKRGGSSYGGDGVGDPPPVWEWVLEADVKEGAEKRGAIEAVLRSATKAVRDGVLTFTMASLTLCMLLIVSQGVS